VDRRVVLLHLARLAPAHAALRRRGAAIGIGGEVWALHGGGFYRAQKFAVAPPELPETLHWFKWEAYSTWLSGVFLLGLIYYLGAEVYLIDRRSPTCRSRRRSRSASRSSPAAGSCTTSCAARRSAERAVAGRGDARAMHAGRVRADAPVTRPGAFIHFGAMLGTIMAANVLMVIMPGQARDGEGEGRDRVPDPKHARAASSAASTTPTSRCRCCSR
jgi:uncharacterized membrane protein